MPTSLQQQTVGRTKLVQFVQASPSVVETVAYKTKLEQLVIDGENQIIETQSVSQFVLTPSNLSVATELIVGRDSRKTIVNFFNGSDTKINAASIVGVSPIEKSVYFDTNEVPRIPAGANIEKPFILYLEDPVSGEITPYYWEPQ